MILYEKVQCSQCQHYRSCSAMTRLFVNYCGSNRAAMQKLIDKACGECRARHGQVVIKARGPAARPPLAPRFVRV